MSVSKGNLSGTRLRIVVMCGGPSAERDVSLRSGDAVARALRDRGHHIELLDPVDENWDLPRDVEAVFLALHGTYGEDGTVQRRLDTLGVPYTGCDAEASAIAFDKLETKRRCAEAGVATPRHAVVADPLAGWPAGFEPPMVVKPVRHGSSVGLAFVSAREEWTEALAGVMRVDRRALAEERVLGRELTVGILEDRALPLVEVRPRNGHYDYHHKYTPGATEYQCPAGLSSEVTHATQAAALKAFQAVGGRDYGRVDVMLDREEKPWVLEVNTLPGMTETSLFPKAAAASGIDFMELCQRLVDFALRRSGNRQVIS
jgi:D-alanine-D-alanine ligase